MMMNGKNYERRNFKGTNKIFNKNPSRILADFITMSLIIDKPRLCKSTSPHDYLITSLVKIYIRMPCPMFCHLHAWLLIPFPRTPEEILTIVPAKACPPIVALFVLSHSLEWRIIKPTPDLSVDEFNSLKDDVRGLTELIITIMRWLETTFPNLSPMILVMVPTFPTQKTSTPKPNNIPQLSS